MSSRTAVANAQAKVQALRLYRGLLRAARTWPDEISPRSDAPPSPQFRNLILSKVKDGFRKNRAESDPVVIRRHMTEGQAELDTMHSLLNNDVAKKYPKSLPEPAQGQKGLFKIFQWLYG